MILQWGSCKKMLLFSDFVQNGGNHLEKTVFHEQVAHGAQLRFACGVPRLRDAAHLKPCAFGGFARIGRVLKHHAFCGREFHVFSGELINFGIPLADSDIVNREKNIEKITHAAVCKRLFGVLAVGQGCNRHGNTRIPQGAEQFRAPSRGLASASYRAQINSSMPCMTCAGDSVIAG